MKILPTPFPQSPRQNRLLAALPAAEFAALLPQLELVALPLGWAVYESGEPQGYDYFPTTSVVWLDRVLADGSAAGSAFVGNEGMLGIASFMGCESTADRALVVSAGYAYRIRSSTMSREFHLSGELRELLLRYVEMRMIQTSQTAVCNRQHSVKQQLCRTLLSLLYRLPSRELAMTQESIAHMLGVRREGITEAAGLLQADGAIHYHRGHISVLDRSKLEAQSCECYAAVRRQYDRLLSAYPLAETASVISSAARALPGNTVRAMR